MSSLIGGKKSYQLDLFCCAMRYACNNDSGTGAVLRQIPAKRFSGQDDLSLNAGGVDQMNPISHSHGQAHVLNIETFCGCRDGNEIAIANPGFQPSYPFLRNDKQGPSADRPFN